MIPAVPPARPATGPIIFPIDCEMSPRADAEWVGVEVGGTGSQLSTVIGLSEQRRALILLFLLCSAEQNIGGAYHTGQKRRRRKISQTADSVHETNAKYSLSDGFCIKDELLLLLLLLHAKAEALNSRVDLSRNKTTPVPVPKPSREGKRRKEEKKKEACAFTQSLMCCTVRSCSARTQFPKKRREAALQFVHRHFDLR